MDGFLTILGIFGGSLSALWLDRERERKRVRKNGVLVLRALKVELSDNAVILREVKQDFIKTDWGRSFFLSSTAWETALSRGNLEDSIGQTLADEVSIQYAHILKIKYYVDLLTRLWMVPNQINGYNEMQRGFTGAIELATCRVLDRHARVVGQIEHELLKRNSMS